MMISICVPIIVAGKTVGVAGIDYGMDRMKEIVSAIKPFDTGIGSINFIDGSVVAHPDAKLVGKTIASADALAAIKSGQQYMETAKTEYFSGDTLSVYTPIPFGPSFDVWNLAVAVSMDKILAETKSLRNMSIAIGLLSMIVLLVVVYALATLIITRPINLAVAGLQDIAQGEGDLTMRLRSDRRDEKGDLGRWFNTFIIKLQDIIQQISVNSNKVGASVSDLAGVAAQLSRGAKNTSQRANDVASTAEEMCTNLTSVASAMEESSANTNMVASAAEEMSATIREIADNISQASSGIQEVNENVNQSSIAAGEITRNISLVNGEAGDISQSSHQVTASSTQLQEMAAELNTIVSRFKL